MIVTGLAVDGETNAPYVVLETKNGQASFPIWIGVFEASAIAMKLEGLAVARPLTHDLGAELLRSLGGELVRIEIVDLKENTYYAHLMVKAKDGKVARIDSRPSDAIALALRCDAAIMVEDKVIEKSGRAERTGKWRKAQTGGGPEPKKPDWKEVLQNLSDEAFGKYKM